MARVRIAWQGGEVTAYLRDTPTSKQLLTVLPCEPGVHVTQCNVLGRIKGDPRQLKQVKPGTKVRVELLSELV